MKISHIFTERDNSTLCPMRIAYFSVFCVFMGISIFNLASIIEHIDAWTTSALKIIAAALPVIGKAALTETPPQEGEQNGNTK